APHRRRRRRAGTRRGRGPRARGSDAGGSYVSYRPVSDAGGGAGVTQARRVPSSGDCGTALGCRAASASRPGRRIKAMRIRAVLLVACALTAACGRDAADREYFVVLAMEKTESAPIATRIPPGAESDLDRAIVLADRPYLRFVRGLIRCRAGRCAESLADLDQAIAAQPENAQLYRGRALARS